MIGLALLHGWGYGPEVWRDYAAAFAERPVFALDAGYFGPARMTLPENPDGWIGVGHSLGFAKLLGMDVPWRGIIGLGAFLRFCAAPGRTGGTPPEIVEAMLARLKEDPRDVLRRFLRRCGQRPKPSAPLLPSPDAAGVARLAGDLTLLRDLNAKPPRHVPPCLLLHARDDRIAPVALAEEAGQAMDATLSLFDSGGHALPFVNPDECVPVLKEFIECRATAS